MIRIEKKYTVQMRDGSTQEIPFRRYKVGGNELLASPMSQADAGLIIVYDPYQKIIPDDPTAGFFVLYLNGQMWWFEKELFKRSSQEV